MTPIALALIIHSSFQHKPMKVSVTLSSPAIPTPVQESVVQTVNTLEKAWNSHDMDLYGTVLADDIQWVNVVGMWWVGKEAVLRAHRAFHGSIFKNVSFFNEELSLRLIAPNVVNAVLTTQMGAYVTPDQKQVPASKNRLTLTLVPKGDRWVIAAAQNTVVDAIAAQFDPGKG